MGVQCTAVGTRRKGNGTQKAQKGHKKHKRIASQSRFVLLVISFVPFVFRSLFCGAKPPAVTRMPSREVKSSIGFLYQDRVSYESGTTELDDYLHQQASQDAWRNVGAPFVIVDQERRVVGSYTLSAYSISCSRTASSTGQEAPQISFNSCNVAYLPTCRPSSPRAETRNHAFDRCLTPELEEYC